MRRLPLALVACAITFMAEAAGPGSIEPKALGDRIAWADQALVVLDVRTRSQFDTATGQIPGSVRVLPDQIASWANAQDRERSVVAYCT